MWQVTEVRPKVTLVVRMAAAVANYDYIMDWEFQTDGLIRSKVSDVNSIDLVFCLGNSAEIDTPSNNLCREETST